MHFEQTLRGLKISIDREIAHQFEVAIKDVQKSDPFLAEALKQIEKIALAGGKRIRGALLVQSYFGFGGKEKRKILKVAAAIELMHLFLLVHDDIIDQGNLRHGEQTLHQMFAKKYQKEYGIKAKHFGDSMAIIMGDALYAVANKIILEAGFDCMLSLEALKKMQSVIKTTILGQSQDISISYSKSLDQSKVLAMYENKTARYTFEGPLHMGAILAAQSDKKILEILSNYALPLGIAFQIQDDILGVFGKEKKTGKSSASDIEEGKKTLMVVKAFEKATALEKKQLDKILGKENVNSSEIEIFKNLLVSIGALEDCKSQVLNYLKMGKREIEKIIMLPAQKKFLLGIIEYLEKRET